MKSVLAPDSYHQIAIILATLGNEKLAYEFLKLYELKETNKPLMYLTVGNFYNLKLKDYKKSKMILGMSKDITKFKEERYTFFIKGLVVGFLLCLLANLFFKYIGA